MSNRFRDASLSHQLALIAGLGCLLISLALVALAATSSRHMQNCLLYTSDAADE